jgi:hypothetical protein
MTVSWREFLFVIAQSESVPYCIQTIHEAARHGWPRKDGFYASASDIHDSMQAVTFYTKLH